MPNVETKVPEKGDTSWYPPQLDVFLNHWFARYDEARAWLEREGGFLLPYRHHFFVCQAEAIRVMGLDPDDPDWKKVGWDCARPADHEAYERLYAKRARLARRQS